MAPQNPSLPVPFHETTVGLTTGDSAAASAAALPPAPGPEHSAPVAGDRAASPAPDAGVGPTTLTTRETERGPDRPPDLGGLPRITIWKSWRSGPAKLPHFYIRGRGGQMESIVRSVLAALWRERGPGTQLAVAGEMTDLEGVVRPLRVVHQVCKGHRGITDVLFRTEGNDLYVRFFSNPRTRITWLRVALYLLGFLALFSASMAAYMFVSGSYASWVTDFAQKHARELYVDNDAATFLEAVILRGQFVFNNEKFVRDMESRGAADLLLDWVPNGAEQFLRERSANRSRGLPLFGVHAGAEALFADHFGRMRCDGIAMLGLERVEERYNGNEYFARYQRNKIVGGDLALGIDGVRPVAGIECVDRAILDEAVRTDYGRGHEELSRMAKECAKEATAQEGPWTLWRLFWEDPKLAFFNVGGPSTILAMVVGVVLYFVPMSVLRLPCRLLGWPTPDEFSAIVDSRNSWVNRVLSDVLLHEYGVTEEDKIVIGAAA